MGDNVMGSFRTNRPPRGRRLGRGRGFRTFRLVRRWFRHESGGIERIAWPLTGSVCSFIVRSIPEGLMFREFSSIWEIQDKISARIWNSVGLDFASFSTAVSQSTFTLFAKPGRRLDLVRTFHFYPVSLRLRERYFVKCDVPPHHGDNGTH